MKALIFAAGLGTRLKPWTDSHPKALAPIGGEAMLGRVIGKLKNYGITEFVINVHHFAGQIAEYLHAHDDFGSKIVLSDESGLLLDTGGGLLKARNMLSGSSRILIHNADIFTDFDISRMQAFAESRPHAAASLLVKDRATQRYLAFDSTHRMRGWTNLASGQTRPAHADLSDCVLRAFGGVHIVDSSIFNTLSEYNESLLGTNPDRDTLDGICKFSITDFYIDNCERIEFTAYEPAEDYTWIDIGKAENLEAADKLVVHG